MDNIIFYLGIVAGRLCMLVIDIIILIIWFLLVRKEDDDQ